MFSLDHPLRKTLVSIARGAVNLLPGALRMKVRDKLRVTSMCSLYGKGPIASRCAALEANNLAFIHIPKAAGNAITHAIYGDQSPGHFYARAIRRYYGATRYQELDSFAVVRNPWDRTYSAYQYLKEGGAGPKGDARFRQMITERYPTFRDFVMEWMNPEAIEIQVHFYPQWRFLCDDDGNLIVKTLLRQEHLDQDFEAFCSKHGIPTDLQRQNATHQRENDHQAVYDAEMSAKIHDLYRRDVELLGYQR